MKRKYNLAFVPQTEAAKVVTLAKALSAYADRYQLGAHSLPHVTLHHFMFEENKVTNLWEQVKEEGVLRNIDLCFEQFSATVDAAKVHWAALLPTQTEVLFTLHAKIAKILNLEPKKNYQPHMTLINSKNKDYERELAKLALSYQPLRDNFSLALGYCDPVGQLTALIHTVAQDSESALN